MNSRTVKTSLIGKDELFKVIALAEVIQLPVLFIGVPGVAKTQALLDYVSALVGGDLQAARNKCFVIELDEGTKSTEVKGRIDMQEFLENKRYKIDAPIADAEYILINEVDKGNSGIRNAMLSIMREKALFLGSEIKECKWKLFTGSCNTIPEDELESPFWDRFLIKYRVERVEPADFAEIWTGEEKHLKMNVPTIKQLEEVTINGAVMNAMLDTVYKDLSDRTLTQMPLVVKAVKAVWEMDDESAAVKACELLAPNRVMSLSKKIQDSRITSLRSDFDMLMKAVNSGQEYNKDDRKKLYIQVRDLDQKLDATRKETYGTGKEVMVDEIKSALSQVRSSGILRSIMLEYTKKDRKGALDQAMV